MRIYEMSKHQCTRTKQWLKGYKLLLSVVDKIYKESSKASDEEDNGLKWLASMFSYEELSDINGVLFTADLPIEMIHESLEKNHIMSAMNYFNEYWCIYNFPIANEWMKNNDYFKNIRESVLYIIKVLNSNDDVEIKKVVKAIGTI
jgi:hypothetical protein